MPAYETKFTDPEIWTLVGFIRSLQQGQAVPLPVPTPSSDQMALAHNPVDGNAQHGAALHSAMGCATSHEPAGDLSIHPADDAVARVLRVGQPGMPCFSASLLSDADILDIRAYIATFPTIGQLSTPMQFCRGCDIREFD